MSAIILSTNIVIDDEPSSLDRVVELVLEHGLHSVSSRCAGRDGEMGVAEVTEMKYIYQGPGFINRKDW